MFKEIGRADELGSGVRKLFKYSKSYCGHDPELVEGDVFRLELMLGEVGDLDVCSGKTSPKTSPKTSEKILELMRGNGKITTEQIGAILARISHQPSAVAADPPAVSGLSSRRRPRRYSGIDSGGFGPNDPTQQGLDDFATKSGEKSGLGVTKRAVLLHTRELQNAGQLKRIGPANGGHWEVLV